MKLKLYRDKVISVVNGKDLVGVYIKIKEYYLCPHTGAKVKHCRECLAGTEILLAEMPPKQADKIIKLWNQEN